MVSQLTQLTPQIPRQARQLSGIAPVTDDTLQKLWASRLASADDEDKRLFESRARVCQGLSEYIDKLQQACEQNKVESLGPKIQDVFDPIYRFVQLMSPAACVAIGAYPNPGSLVLGGIIAVLEAANRTSQYQKLAVQKFAEMSDKASSLFQLEGPLYADDKAIQRLLLEIYGDILDFCVKAFKLVESKKGAILAKVRGLGKQVYQEFEDQLGPQVDNYKTHMDQLRDQISIRDSKRLYEIRYEQGLESERNQDARKAAEEHYKRHDDFIALTKREEHLREERKNEKRRQDQKKDMLSWLSVDYFGDGFEEKRDQYLEGTGTWLKDSAEYQKWKWSDESGLIWIKGKAGCGKSVLTAMIIDEELAPERGAKVTLAYAFCRKGNEAKQTATAILRALCRDVVKQLREVPAEVKSAFLSANFGESPSRRTIRKILSSAISQCSSTFLIVDALDEILDFSERMDLAKELCAIARDQPAGAVKILVSSRTPNSDFDDVWRGYAQMEPDVNNSEDLNAYIEFEFADTNSNEAEKKINAEIRDLCSRKAQGMFLWVKLLALSLKSQRGPPHKRIERANKVPSGLVGVYDTMLDDLWKQDEEERADAILVLLWTMNAKRPLRSEELLHAVIDYRDANRLSDRAGYQWPDAGQLVSRCCNLVYIDQSNVVRVVHGSVEDYLKGSTSTATNALREFQALGENAHERLAMICIQYLLLKDFESGPAQSRDGLNSLVDRAPFILYAAKFWGFHAAKLDTQDFGHNIRAISDSPSRRELSMQMHLYRDDDDRKHWLYVTRSNPLHILAAFGLRDAAQSLPRAAEYCSRGDASGCTPLHYALIGSHHELCLWLFQQSGGQAGEDVRLSAVHRSAAFGWTALLEYLLMEDTTLVNEKMSTDGPTALSRTASAGQLDAADLLIKYGADVNLKDGEDNYPILLAANNRHWDLLKLLLEHGAETSHSDKAGYTALHRAAQSGQHDSADALLAKGAEPSQPNVLDRDWTALHYAANNDAGDVIRIIFGYCTDLDVKHSAGSTPLVTAAFNNKPFATRTLIELGASIDEPAKNGMTPLIFAALNNHVDIVGLLLDAKCDVHLMDKNGCTVFHAIAKSGSTQGLERILRSQALETWPQLLNQSTHIGHRPIHFAIQEHNVNMALDLLARGADPTLLGQFNGNSLHSCAYFGVTELIRPLLEYLQDINLQDDRGATALHLAALSNQFEFLETLFAESTRGALQVDLDAQDHQRKTALIVALERDYRESAELLIERGARSIRDSDGQYPIHFAAWHGFDTMVTKLLDQPGVTEQGYYSRTPLACASQRGHLTTVKILAGSSKEVLNTPADEGGGPIALAIQFGHPHVANYLLDIGADHRVTASKGETLLHFAADQGDLQLTKRLLDMGCDVAAQTDSQRTALYAAAEGGNLEVVDELLDRGADPKVPDILGATCTMLAAIRRDLKMLARFDKAGATTPFFDAYGRSAASHAAADGQWEVLSFLEQRAEDLDSEDAVGHTPLMRAVADGYIFATEYLIAKGANVNKTAKMDFRTPLASAASRGFVNCTCALLRGGADATIIDWCGLTATDYAFRFAPSRLELLKAGHARLPKTRETTVGALHDAIQDASQRLLQYPNPQSPVENTTRLASLDRLLGALLRLRDFDSAAECALELFYEPARQKPGGGSVNWSCDLCGMHYFSGDVYFCKTCHHSPMLCEKCYRAYKDAGQDTPEAIKLSRAVEHYVSFVRLCVDPVFSLPEVWFATTYFVIGSQWMASVSKIYADWDRKWGPSELQQRYGRSGEYDSLPRPGRVLLNILRRTGELIQRYASDSFEDKDRESYLKLEKEWLRFRPDQELAAFTCKGHEYMVVRDEARKESMEKKQFFDPSTGRLSTSWAEQIKVKYRDAKTVEDLVTAETASTPANPEATDDLAEQIAAAEAETARLDREKRDLLTKFVGKDLFASPTIRTSAFRERRGPIRTFSLPRADHFPGVKARPAFAVEAKDSSIIRDFEASLGLDEKAAMPDGIFAIDELPSLPSRKLTVPLSLDSEHNHTQAEDPSTSNEASGRNTPTLSAEPEPLSGDEDGSVNGNADDPGSTAAAANRSDLTYKIIYHKLHGRPASEKDLKLFKFAVKLTSKMNSDFLPELLRLARD